MAHGPDLEYWRDRTRQFGEASVGYGCNEKSIRWDNYVRERAISRLITVGPGTSVLDVGTAGGYWAIKFARAGATVTGLDFNEEILKIAAQSARASDVEVEWVNSPLEEASIADDSFDVVLSVTCLQHITERDRQAEAVRVILRSLKPGGLFVLLEDTVRGNDRANGYMLSRTQRSWIELIESQGGRLVDYTGVSFVRFKVKRIPASLAARADLLLGGIPALKGWASVTAFSFGVRE
jgi:ubiquinone/menaquinone biosynthesis C-methylase UbiE